MWKETFYWCLWKAQTWYCDGLFIFKNCDIHTFNMALPEVSSVLQSSPPHFPLYVLQSCMPLHPGCQPNSELFSSFSAQMSLHVITTSCRLPSMFILVQGHATVGILARFLGLSTSRPPVITDQWFSVFSVFAKSEVHAPLWLSEMNTSWNCLCGLWF